MRRIWGNRKRLARLGVNLLVSVCAILIFLTLAWLILGFILPQSCENSSKYGWDKECGRRDLRYEARDLNGSSHSVRYITYDLGFRRFSAPDPSKIRVMIIGDSFTEAEAVSNGEEYFAYLERNPRIQLFVKGVSGWASLQEFLLLNDTYELIRPDIVILQFSGNDIIDNDYSLELESINNMMWRRPYLENGSIVYRDPTPYRLPGFLLENTRFKTLLYYYELIFRPKRETIDGKIKAELEAYPEFSKGVNTTDRIIGMMRERAKDSKFFAFDVENPDAPFRPIFERLMAKNGIVVILGVHEAVSNLSAEICVYAEDNTHWNREGHRLAGEFISKYIEEYLGKSLEAKN